MRSFGDRDERVPRFLASDHVMLRGMAPLALAARNSAGLDLAFELLNRAEAGLAA